ncbi:MAG: hypothetical protein JW737_06685 [Acidobacteria bacterium]|nr:hypothetical protein [Acidobacteriota bacterium]
MAELKDLESFIKQLKTGKMEFYSRTHEFEWGCRYLEYGRFESWSRNQLAGEEEHQELDEAAVIKLFAPYSIEILNNGLSPVKEL